MSLLYANGFDNITQPNDLYKAGWLPTALKVVAPVGSSLPANESNGLGGRALSLATLNNYPTAVNTLPGGGSGDPAIYNTGRTVKSLWDAGGFVVGARMRSNISGSLNSPANYTPPNTNFPFSQLSFAVDGDTAYAMRRRNVPGSNLVNVVLSKSTDGCKTWSDMTMPSDWPSSLVNAVVSVPEPGVLWIANGTTVNNSGHWFSTDGGSSWTRCSNIASGSTQSYAKLVKLNNATYKYAALVYCGSTTTGVYVAPALDSATWTKVGGNPTVATAVPSNLRVENGWLVAVYGNGNVMSIPEATLTGGGHTSISPLTTSTLVDLRWINDRWIVTVTSGNPYYNTSSDPRTGTWSVWTSAYGTVGAGARLGSYVYFTTPNCGLIRCQDGVTIEGSLVNLLPFYDSSGTQWNAIDSGNGKLYFASTQTAYAFMTMKDPATFSGMEMFGMTRSAGNAGVYSPFGIVAAIASSLNLSTGAFTVANGGSGSANAITGLYVSATSTTTGVDTVDLITELTATPLATFSVTHDYGASPTPVNNWHYYELVFRADTANVNRFFITVRLDGSIVADTGNTSYALVAAADTTSIALINFPRNGSWDMIDDMYITDFSGTTNVGVMGPVSIIRRRPSTDVTTQWDRIGGAASNAASVSKESIGFMPITQYVESDTQGDTDVYAMADPQGLPDISGRKVRAMLVQGYFSRGGSSVPSAQLGIKSGAATAEGPAAQIVSNTPTLVQQVFETNPNGNVEWTVADAKAAQVTIKNAG